MMDQRGLERLAGGFATGDYFSSSILETRFRSIEVDVGLIFFAAIERDDDQAISFNFCRIGKRKIGFHGDAFQYRRQAGRSASRGTFADRSPQRTNEEHEGVTQSS